MRVFFAVLLGFTGSLLAGCSTPPRPAAAPVLPAARVLPAPSVLQAGYFAAGGKDDELSPPKKLGKESPTGTGIAQGVGLPELIGLTLERNPRLARAAFAVDTARGRAVQSGLYPNPTLIYT